MTHRDGFPRLSARSAWRGDARHRKPCAPSTRIGPSESLGKPPFRSGGRTAGGRRKALTMPRIARGFPATRPVARPLARRIACPISMGHYQRSLVLFRAVPAQCPAEPAERGAQVRVLDRVEPALERRLVLDARGRRWRLARGARRRRNLL